MKNNWTTNSELQLATHVALRVDDWKPSHGCPAWIKSKDRQCGRAPYDKDGGVLCKRHRTVASRRHEKRMAELTAQILERKAAK
jgi:hypothetical protein